MCSKSIFSIFILFFTINNVFANNVTSDQYENLTDGDPCVWEDVTGVCVYNWRCETYKVDFRTNNPPPVCGKDKKSPIICCTGCRILSLASAKYNENYFNEKEGNTGVRHSDKCIQYHNYLGYPECPVEIWRYKKKRIYDDYERRFCYEDGSTILFPIVGGVPANRSEFPHMTLLGYGADVKSAQWLCGGSLISDRFILTAAHCRSAPAVGEVKYVGLGMLRRTDPDALWSRYNVSRFIPHPEYRSPRKYHDIALIETDRKVRFSRVVLPACITNANHEDLYRDVKVFATGWGGLGYRQNLADVLQKVELQRFEELECAIQYPPSRNLRAGYNHSTQMCYGDRDKPRDTCGGDSGGPLQIRLHGSQCTQVVVVGVTSYGGACGFAGSAGMYTRVRDYVPWIEDIVWPLSSASP